MTNRTIKHEVKLQPVVIILLAVLAIGVFANAFVPAFAIKEALAAYTTIDGSLNIYCTGCN